MHALLWVLAIRALLALITAVLSRYAKSDGIDGMHIVRIFGVLAMGGWASYLLITGV